MIDYRQIVSDIQNGWDVIYSNEFPNSIDAIDNIAEGKDVINSLRKLYGDANILTRLQALYDTEEISLVLPKLDSDKEQIIATIKDILTRIDDEDFDMSEISTAYRNGTKIAIHQREDKEFVNELYGLIREMRAKAEPVMIKKRKENQIKNISEPSDKPPETSVAETSDSKRDMTVPKSVKPRKPKTLSERILSGDTVYVKFEQFQSPGDILTLTPNIRDLKKKYPNIKIKLRTSCKEIWDHNPYLDKFDDEKIDYESKLDYSLVNQSNQTGRHMIYGFKEDIENKLGIRYDITEFKCDVHLSQKETKWMNQVEQNFGLKEPFWLINAGSKSDFPLKQWPYEKWQEVVNQLKDRINFVQIGSDEHNHKALDGVYNLLGQTDLRQLIRLAYHAEGGFGHVSMLNHLMSCWRKPSVVVAGGRETATWEGYNGTQYIHTIGLMDCCKFGGCWKSKPEDCPKMDANEFPRCMNIIEPDEVVKSVEKAFRWKK